MALGDKLSPGNRHKITGNATASLSSSFAEGKHVDLQSFPGEAALLYQIQKMEEDIDELRRYVTNEATGSVINLKSIDTSALPTSQPPQKNALWIETTAKGAKYIRST